MKTLQSAPLSLREHTDLAAVAATVQAEVKAAGNAAFKGGRHDEAIGLYTTLIALDPSQPVFLSNRSAAYQAKRMWREAAADAQVTPCHVR